MGWNIPEIENLTEGKKWNKRVYGNEKYGYRIYLEGAETRITNEQYAAWIAAEKKNKLEAMKKEAIESVNYLLSRIPEDENSEYWKNLREKRRAKLLPAMEEIEKATKVSEMETIKEKYGI